MKFRLFFILICVFYASSYPCFAETIFMTLNQNTVFPGDTITLNIEIDMADNISGSTFTLRYPSEYLTFDNVSTEFFKTIYDNRDGANPSQIDPWQANNNVPGKIALSGAYINSTTGGPQYTGKQTLFSIQFAVNSNLQVSTINFEIEQTRILNIDAGWGTNGIAEPAPIIVKSYPVGSAQRDTPALDDDYEVILSSFSSNPTLAIDVYSADSDNDGINDQWEIDNFGDLVTVNGTSDYDQDGYLDIVEYENGTDPIIQTTPGGFGYDQRTDNRVPKVNPAINLLLLN